MGVEVNENNVGFYLFFFGFFVLWSLKSCSYAVLPMKKNGVYAIEVKERLKKKEEVFDRGKETSRQVVTLLYWQPCP